MKLLVKRIIKPFQTSIHVDSFKRSAKFLLLTIYRQIIFNNEVRIANLTEIVTKPLLDVKVVRWKYKNWFNYSITWPCLICCRRKLFPVVKFTLNLEHSRYINHKTINADPGNWEGATLNRKSTHCSRNLVPNSANDFFIVTAK